MDILRQVFDDEDWREDLDPELTRKLEKLLKRVKPFEDAYKKSDHAALAQLWVAIVEVYIQVEKMNRRLFHIERMLTEKSQDGSLQDEELSDSLREY